MRGKRALRLMVTSVAALPRRKFGKLVTRELPLADALGGASFLYEFLPPRTALPRIHHRRTAELVFCVKGSMTAYLGRRRFRIKAGSLIIIPPGVRHKFVTSRRACEAVSLFYPGLSIGPGADIEAEA